MGFSDLKDICSICGKEVGLDRYKLIKDKSWICSKCLRKAEGDKVVNFLTHTAKDVREMIAEKRIKDEIGDNNFLNDQLNTAEEMYKFCIDRKIRRYWIEKRSLKHFKVIEENLLEDENVEMAFLGLYNYKFSNKKNKKNKKFAYAITDRSILMGRRNMIFGKKFDEICLSSINNITYKTGIAIDIITLHTKDRNFTLGTDKKTAKIIDYKIKRAAKLGTGNKSNDKLNNNMINNDKLKHTYYSYSNGNINTSINDDMSYDSSNNINYNNSNNNNSYNNSSYSSDISDSRKCSDSSNCSRDNRNYGDSSNYSSDNRNYNNSNNINYHNSYNNSSDINDNSRDSNCSRYNGNYNNSYSSISDISNFSNHNSNDNSRSINKNDATHNNISKSYDKNYNYENDKDENVSSEYTYNNDDTICVIDDIKKFKELLDMDILTEKEFQLKKKELLGL